MSGRIRLPMVLFLASFLLVVAGATNAQLTPPARPADAASARFTLGDIWNRLTNGAPGVLRAGAFLEPAAGPATVSTKTTNEIMAAAPAADNTFGAIAANVLKGRKFWGLRTSGGTWGLQGGTMENQGAVTMMPGSSSQPILAGYHNGSGTVLGDADLRPSNIKDGTDIFGVVGTATVATGTAVVANVLLGATFSIAGAAGLTGTMANRGAVSITPGTAQQAILAGYHNGSGTVAGDADLVAGNIKSGVNVFGVAGTHPIAGVPKTGQGKCWKFEAAEWVEDVGCVTNNPPGQDGMLEKGLAWPVPRFTDNGDGTVTDNMTRLIWLKNTICFWSVTWSEALAAAATLNHLECDLTDGSNQGDWRIPNRREMSSLVHDAFFSPAIPNTSGTGQWAEGDPFTHMVHWAAPYWTSTTLPHDPSLAWAAYMNFGSITDANKGNLYNAWPVKGGQ